MQIAARCRKCGRAMSSQRIDNYRVKMTCPCGFSDFRTITEKVKTVNPFYHKANFTPYMESEKGKMVLTMQRANREHMEIISLEEISMLVSSDFELADVLQSVADKLARQLNASVCNIYLLEEGELVLKATYGFEQEKIGQIRLKIGEGITGTVAKEMQPLNLSRASQDPRYKVFPELNEEKYNSMLSFPITDRKSVYGVINLQTTSMRSFPEDEIYFVSIIANLILSAIKLRQKVASNRMARGASPAS
ncbi:GAF domain-containing protein [Geobacter sp. SVR]|uniref:GAF domain-containing protein n=1 Tax=Geobacter sp. SVR TaxID=2495594 RepID=UPI00143EF5D2|nr:GAF domain-containing protein [Geobacter sp. SVR]BCS52071.1 GAF domain-containing protein [Geobacter sp. SVR]GCF86526.1 GAF domain-containing protein [Geobacter sp. SVR]